MDTFTTMAAAVIDGLEAEERERCDPEVLRRIVALCAEAVPQVLVPVVPDPEPVELVPRPPRTQWVSAPYLGAEDRVLQHDLYFRTITRVAHLSDQVIVYWSRQDRQCFESDARLMVSSSRSGADRWNVLRARLDPDAVARIAVLHQS